LTQRLIVPADTPTRAATSLKVGSSGVNSAGSLVGDAAIEGSLKSRGVKHSETIQQAESEPVTAGRSDTTPAAGRPAVGYGEQSIHLHPTAALAERVLLPGDPGRALLLAQYLCEQPLMFNHHRGLWGYTGMAADGEPLTIQSTGMGGPSAAIVLHELIALGVTRAIRVGTCGALDPTLGLGDLVVAREAIAADGTSAALGADRLTRADRVLADALVEQTGHYLRTDARNCREGRIVSTDLFYETDSERNVTWRAEGAIAVEMEASTLFAVGAAAGIQVACILAVTDTFNGGPDARTRIDDDALVTAAQAMGDVSLRALQA
jgi:DeoD family purine-nucleoside phosphorylase